MKLEILDKPDYGIAHPEDSKETYSCEMCLLIIRPDTGEIILLWKCGGINWGVSRNMPRYKKHRRELQDYLEQLEE